MRARRSRSQGLTGLAVMLAVPWLLVGCGSGEIRPQPTAQPSDPAVGEVRHVFGELAPDTSGDCSLSTDGVVAAAESTYFVSVNRCQRGGGDERPSGPRYVAVLEPGEDSEDIERDLRPLTAAPDGTLYATDRKGELFVRHPDESWRPLVDGRSPQSGDPCEGGGNGRFVSDAALAPDGSLLFTLDLMAEPRICSLSPTGTVRTLAVTQPRPPVNTPLVDGAAVPAPPHEGPSNIEIAPDGTVYVVGDELVRVLDPDGQLRTVLSAEMGASTPAATIAPLSTSLEGSMSSCCYGTKFSGAVTGSDGSLYLGADGRVLRFKPGQKLSLVVGKVPEDTGRPHGQRVPQEQFESDGNRVRRADDVVLGERSYVSGGQGLALLSNGDLVVNLANQVVVVGGVEELPDR